MHLRHESCNGRLLPLACFNEKPSSPELWLRFLFVTGRSSVMKLASMAKQRRALVVRALLALASSSGCSCSASLAELRITHRSHRNPSSFCRYSCFCCHDRLPYEVTSTSFSTVNVVVATTTPTDFVAGTTMLVRAGKAVLPDRAHARSFLVYVPVPAVLRASL